VPGSAIVARRYGGRRHSRQLHPHLGFRPRQPSRDPAGDDDAERLVNLYDLMDSAYDAAEIKAHSRGLGHVPIIERQLRRDAPSNRNWALEEKRKALVGYGWLKISATTSAAAPNGSTPLEDNHGGRTVQFEGRRRDVSSDVRRSGHRRYPDHPPRHVATDVARKKDRPSPPRYREGGNHGPSELGNTVLAKKSAQTVPGKIGLLLKQPEAYSYICKPPLSNVLQEPQ